MSKSTLEISTPYLPHAIVANGKQGFSFAFSYPGYFSYLGQASLYYSNSLGDSYFGSIGEWYIMLGVNKQIIKFSKSSIFLNANIGTTVDVTHRHLGSFGISHLQQITHRSKIELVLDLYFNHGISGDFIIHDITYSMGFLGGVNYAFDISPSLLLNLGVGLSLVKYRYAYFADGGVHHYRYIAKPRGEYGDDYTLGWDSRYIIPFGITLSYKF